MTNTRNLTWEERLARWQAVLARFSRWEASFERRMVQLAKHYAAKAGYPKADGYTFFCLHNWTIGNGPEAGNEYAKKALAAWNGRWGNYHARKARISHLAWEKYLRSTPVADEAELNAMLAGIGTR